MVPNGAMKGGEGRALRVDIGLFDSVVKGYADGYGESNMNIIASVKTLIRSMLPRRILTLPF